MEPQTNPTHPNAYHVEADAERLEAAKHAGRANELEAEAERLERELGITQPTAEEEPADKEETGTAESDKKSGLFNNKR